MQRPPLRSLGLPLCLQSASTPRLHLRQSGSAAFQFCCSSWVLRKRRPYGKYHTGFGEAEFDMGAQLPSQSSFKQATPEARLTRCLDGGTSDLLPLQFQQILIGSGNDVPAYMDVARLVGEST